MTTLRKTEVSFLLDNLLVYQHPMLFAHVKSVYAPYILHDVYRMCLHSNSHALHHSTCAPCTLFPTLYTQDT